MRLLVRTVILAIITFIFTSLSFFYFFPAFSSSPPEVRVGITLLNDYVELSYGSNYRLINTATGAPLPIPPGRYRLVNTASGIQVVDTQGRSRGVYRGPFYLQPLSPQQDLSFQLHNARFGLSYRGALEVIRVADRLVAVNILDLESYLRGVVPREMPSSWGNYGGMEALKAQAVAARTYALCYHGQGRHADYHVCDSQHCQVYGGVEAETPNTDRAVEMTRGEILTFNGRAISPFYHATNGGYTELPQNVWSVSLEYFKSEHDPYDDPDNPLGLGNMVIHRHATWEMDIPVGALGQLLAEAGHIESGKVESIVVSSTFPSGRVNELRLNFAGGGSFSLYKEKARTALGLRSQLYTVRDNPEPRVWIVSNAGGVERKESLAELEGKWVAGAGGVKNMLIGDSFPVLSKGGRDTVPYAAFIFEGRGFGHGIGMSQNGAYNRSRVGHNYREILSFYYPGTQLVRGY